MSVKVMAAVWDAEALSPTHRLILLSLADHANDDGICYPSIARLCRRTGLSERSVQGAVSFLQAAGWLRVERNAGPKGCNVFTVCTPAGDAPPQDMRPRRRCATPPQHVRPTPAGDAPEPSGTIKEPSFSLSERVSDDLDAAFADYNEMAQSVGLPLCAKRTKGRVQAVRARLREHGLGVWREALARVAASPHCTGQNDRGWRADLDFIATASKFVNIIEGRYDARPRLAVVQPGRVSAADVLRGLK